jgi:hypothetical protein
MVTDDESDGLAPLYVAILDLLDHGADEAAVASQLELDIEAVPGLVELATAKRRSRRPRPDPTSDHTT